MVYSCPDDYLYNLEVCTSSQAKKLWKNSIKEEWNLECAYCGSPHNLTLDHILAQSKGGDDTRNNVICACKACNQSKGHNPWKDWYTSQKFFTEARMSAILEWMDQDKVDNLIVYRPRKNFLLS